MFLSSSPITSTKSSISLPGWSREIRICLRTSPCLAEVCAQALYPFFWLERPSWWSIVWHPRISKIIQYFELYVRRSVCFQRSIFGPVDGIWGWKQVIHVWSCLLEKVAAIHQTVWTVTQLLISEIHKEANGLINVGDIGQKPRVQPQSISVLCRNLRSYDVLHM